MKILLFAGAGTSVELGVPSMAGLATEFLAHCCQWNVEPRLVEQIMGDNLDVEYLIEELDRICAAETSLRAIGHDTDVLGGAQKVRGEVEWFVQHAAERVAASDAKLMWGSVIQAAKSVEITFVTTNYDRAIELAANSEGVGLDDGFGSVAEKEAQQWVGFGQSARPMTLIKLHGSTDWYEDVRTGDSAKLRHPMPLFGRTVLKYEGQEFDSALVLPSREKMLTRAPYPRLSQKFLNAADSCDLALFVGSSLRDNHIRNAVRSIAEKVPVFIVNPYGNDHEIGRAAVIQQHASTFLMATLPNALVTPDPPAVLRGEEGGTGNNVTSGILSTVKDLLDTSVDAKRRCHAIEVLDEAGVTLACCRVKLLLADTDPTVARYALGLIPSSTSQEELIEAAENSLHGRDPAFCEELEILKKMVRNS